MALTRRLDNIHLQLREQHAAPAGPDLEDPFQLILWEQVGYLVSDERRRKAFELLASRFGLYSVLATLVYAPFAFFLKSCRWGHETSAED